MQQTSMCQPGRPGPQGEGQDGSPGLDDFQSAKSDGCSFSLDDAFSDSCPSASAVREALPTEAGDSLP